MALVRNHERARIVVPLCLFPVLSICDLFCIHNELKSVQLRTMNRERAEMVIDGWMAEGHMPTAAQVGRGRAGRGRRQHPLECRGGAYGIPYLITWLAGWLCWIRFLDQKRTQSHTRWNPNTTLDLV